jgi:hypothetical protein
MFYNEETYAALIDSGRVTTWADGYGNWHALVPETMASALVARGAIWFELRARYTTPDGPPRRPKVVQAPTTREGMTHWKEVE